MGMFTAAYSNPLILQSVHRILYSRPSFFQASSNVEVHGGQFTAQHGPVASVVVNINCQYTPLVPYHMSQHIDFSLHSARI